APRPSSRRPFHTQRCTGHGSRPGGEHHRSRLSRESSAPRHASRTLRSPRLALRKHDQNERRGADLFDRTGGRPPPANVSCSHLFERTGADDPLARRSANSPAIACFLPLAPVAPRRSEPAPKEGNDGGFRHQHHRPRRDRHRTGIPRRSEEHTSELQSRENLVCRLLLEKKKTKTRT